MNITDMDDEYVKLAEHVGEGIGQAQIPGKFWVEFFPFTRYLPGWIPGVQFKKHAEYYKPMINRMVSSPFEAVKRAMVCLAF